MSITTSEPDKVDDRPSLYIRDEYARKLPSDLDIGDVIDFSVKAEVTGVSKNKYEDDNKEHISFDFKINEMGIDGKIDEVKVLEERDEALGTTSLKTVKKLFGDNKITIVFKKED